MPSTASEILGRRPERSESIATTRRGGARGLDAPLGRTRQASTGGRESSATRPPDRRRSFRPCPHNSGRLGRRQTEASTPPLTQTRRAPSPSRPYQRLRSLPPSSPDVLNDRHADRGTNTHSFHPGPRVQPATLLLLAQSGTVDLATALEEPTTRGDGAFRQREETADRTSSDGPDGTPGHRCLCLATPALLASAIAWNERRQPDCRRRARRLRIRPRASAPAGHGGHLVCDASRCPRIGTGLRRLTIADQSIPSRSPTNSSGVRTG